MTGTVYQVQQYKVWKGVDPHKPQWGNLNLVFSEATEAEDMVKYLSRNNPDRQYRSIPQEH